VQAKDQAVQAKAALLKGLQDKVAEIYETLSRDTHKQTVDLGNGRYLVMIRKSLPTLPVCFVQAIAKELYGENVAVQAKADE
jgi:hypothetical protein